MQMFSKLSFKTTSNRCDEGDGLLPSIRVEAMMNLFPFDRLMMKSRG